MEIITLKGEIRQIKLKAFTIHPNIELAETLPSHFYRSQEVFDALIEKVFGKAWQFIGDDSLVSTELSRNPWSSHDNINRRLDKIRNKEKEKEKETMDLINHFQKTFYNIHNREPLESEMIDNLKDKLDIALLMKVYLKMNTDKINKELDTNNSC